MKKPLLNLNGNSGSVKDNIKNGNIRNNFNTFRRSRKLYPAIAFLGLVTYIYYFYLPSISEVNQHTDSTLNSQLTESTASILVPPTFALESQFTASESQRPNGKVLVPEAMANRFNIDVESVTRYDEVPFLVAENSELDQDSREKEHVLQQQENKDQDTFDSNNNNNIDNNFKESEVSFTGNINNEESATEGETNKITIIENGIIPSTTLSDKNEENQTTLLINDLRAIAVNAIQTDINAKPTPRGKLHTKPLTEIPENWNKNCIPKELKYLATNYTAQLCITNDWNYRKNPNVQEIACQYPQLNPFDPVIVPYQGEATKSDLCEKSPKYINSTQIFATDFKSNLITLIPPAQLGFENCCYKNFSRVAESDWKTSTSNTCTPINSNLSLQNIPPEHEFIKIYCHRIVKQDQSSTNKNATEKPDIEFIDMFAFTPLKPPGKTRIEKIKLDNPGNFKEPLNIAILGIDSVSHMQFIRSMPKSYEYIVDKLKAHGLHGFNTIEENTFSNLIPLLTGSHVDRFARINSTCNMKKGPFDNCPFLWKHFASSGYRTVYGEDGSFLSMFNYAKEGFTNQPTDYYIRPFTLDSDEIYYWSTNRTEDSFFPCYAGARLNFQYLLDYMKSVAQTMGNDKRYFELLWGNVLTHTHIHWALEGDAPLFETLTWLNDTNHLNNTLLIVMSDHGMRYAGIRDTLQGRVEARMPFAFFVFPEWFQQKYRLALQNFKDNKYRLTSTFDFHYTLKDLLDLESLEDKNILQRSQEVNKNVQENVRNQNESMRMFGQSLFLPIPKTRLCNETGISDFNCICQQFEPIKDFNEDPWVQRVAQFLVEEINRKLEGHAECTMLKLGKIVGAETVVVSSSDLKSGESQDQDSNRKSKKLKVKATETREVTVTIVTMPGEASFEARLSVNANSRLTKIQGGISRTNMYNNQSHCVNVYELKPYCYCTDL